MLRIIWELGLIRQHNSNRLHMSLGSRCWMHWMWCGYIPSVCSVRQTLMRGTLKRAEIFLVLVCELHWTMSMMFSSSSTFHCTWRSARRFTLGKEPFFLIFWWTRVNTRLLGIRRWGYHSRYASTTAVVLTLQNPYTICVLAYSS
jgi:hypothetical protein